MLDEVFNGFGGNDTVGIKMVENAFAQGKAYDLSGRPAQRLLPNQVYIVDGKKIKYSK